MWGAVLNVDASASLLGYSSAAYNFACKFAVQKSAIPKKGQSIIHPEHQYR